MLTSGVAKPPGRRDCDYDYDWDLGQLRVLGLNMEGCRRI